MPIQAPMDKIREQRETFKVSRLVKGNVVKVQRKIAKFADGKEMKACAVPAYNLTCGRGLFANPGDNGGGWRITHQQTGLSILDNLAGKNHAVAILGAMYRRNKNWDLGEGVVFGKADSINKNGQKKKIVEFKIICDSIKHLMGTFGARSHMKTPVALSGRKEMWVCVDTLYCSKCGSQGILAKGIYRISAVNSKQLLYVTAPDTMECEACGCQDMKRA